MSTPARGMNARPSTDLALAAEEARRNPLAALDLAMARAAPRLAEIVPKGIDPARVMQLAMGQARRDSKLLACTTSSMLLATAQIAALGLEPGTALQQAYLVPRKNRKKIVEDGRDKWVDVHEATAIIGYRGFTLIAFESERIDARATIVNFGDHWKYMDGFAPVLEHSPADEYPADGPVLRGVFCRWRFADGRMDALYWPAHKLLAHRDRFAPRAQYANGRRIDREEDKPITGPWTEHFDAMAQKTMIRMAAKMWPLSSERMRHALTVDDAGELGRLDVGALATLDGKRLAEGAKALRVAAGEPVDMIDAEPESGEGEPGETAAQAVSP